MNQSYQKARGAQIPTLYMEGWGQCLSSHHTQQDSLTHLSPKGGIKKLVEELEEVFH